MDINKMTLEGLEKLALEGERLLIKEMENKYKHLRKVTEEFLAAKEKGIENEVLKEKRGKYLMFGPFGFPVSDTPKSIYRDALEDYKYFAKYIEGFGVSVNWCGINVKSYEEALK